MYCALPGLFGAWRAQPTQHHTGIAGVPIDHHRLDGIDHAFIGTHFGEGLPAAKDVEVPANVVSAERLREEAEKAGLVLVQSIEDLLKEDTLFILKKKSLARLAKETSQPEASQLENAEQGKRACRQNHKHAPAARPQESSCPEQQDDRRQCQNHGGIK